MGIMLSLLILTMQCHCQHQRHHIIYDNGIMVLLASASWYHYWHSYCCRYYSVGTSIGVTVPLLMSTSLPLSVSWHYGHMTTKTQHPPKVEIIHNQCFHDHQPLLKIQRLTNGPLKTTTHYPIVSGPKLVLPRLPQSSKITMSKICPFKTTTPS